MDISHSSSDHGIEMERSFFGSSHGKGPCDGVGGVVKAAATQAVLGKQVHRIIDYCFADSALLFISVLSFTLCIRWLHAI